MAGIEKMTEVIIADARQEANAIIQAAKEEADREKNTAFAEISAGTAKQNEALDKELEDYKLRAESARDLMRRRIVLAKKQEIIGRIVEKTRQSLHDADTATYFSNVSKLFERYCRSEKGEMFFNAKDLERMPLDFAKKIEDAASTKGGTISVNKAPVDIEDGFILVYGGAEENCTFRALIESQKEDLYDEINKMLWRDANGR